jgi:hypothetical protein
VGVVSWSYIRAFCQSHSAFRSGLNICKSLSIKSCCCNLLSLIISINRSTDHLAFLHHFHYQGFQHNLNILWGGSLSAFFFITNFGELGFFFFCPPREKVSFAGYYFSSKKERRPRFARSFFHHSRTCVINAGSHGFLTSSSNFGS